MLFVLAFLLTMIWTCQGQQGSGDVNSLMYKLLPVLNTPLSGSDAKLLQKLYIDRNRCSCRSSDFYTSYKKSFLSVRVHVVNIYERHLVGDKSARDKYFVVYEYLMIVHDIFKWSGKKPGYYIRAQAFVSRDLCGMKLLRRKLYVLNLAHPKTNSIGSHWRQGPFVMTSCQGHFVWSQLSPVQQKFLLYKKI